jgi:hypothetical protein
VYVCYSCTSLLLPDPETAVNRLANILTCITISLFLNSILSFASHYVFMHAYVVRHILSSFKFALKQTMKTQRGSRHSCTLSLTSGLDGGWAVNATPWPLYSRERPGSHCIGGWVGSRAGLGGCGRYCRQSGFDPWTFQPVAVGYTDCAVLAHIYYRGQKKCSWHQGVVSSTF